MMIGRRLRELRESKHLSQGELERRTGLLRCYISRVENGHTVPGVETLERYASALEVPMYRFFYAGDKPPDKSILPVPTWGAKGQERNELRAFAKALSRLDDKQRKLLFATATRMAGSKRK